MRMKKTVANPINAIGNAALAYVQDKKNGMPRSDHFSSLNIRTGVNRNPDAEPEELLSQVREAVNEFVKDAPQFDDLTMLSFKYFG